jgi:hypothetical protein
LAHTMGERREERGERREERGERQEERSEKRGERREERGERSDTVERAGGVGNCFSFLWSGFNLIKLLSRF